jgi:hypothetical protein
MLATGPGNLRAVWVVTGKKFSSVPVLSKNPTRSVLVGRTRTSTRQPTGFTVFGYTCQFQSPVLCLGFFYLWSH